MEVWKRVLSLVLALALAASCLPSLHTYAAEIPEETKAAVEETVPEETMPEETADPTRSEETTAPTQFKETAAPIRPEKTAPQVTAGEEAPELLSGAQTVELPFQLNPLYEGILDASDFDQTQPQIPQTSTLSDPLTVAEAAQDVRESLKSRTESIVICFEYDASETFQTASKALFAEVFAHTGVPTEGDYLAWQYGGYQASASYTTDEITNTYTATYTVTYYTTAAQEEEVDTAVSRLLSELDLSGKSDYEKIKGIYDYICGNITYDYTNLNDSDYKLKYTAYAALIDETAVCQGYAVLLYRLALELGVDCRLISGTGNGGAHGWNIVQMDDQLYYDADSTWDAGKSSYSYFLKCDANFTGHTRSDEFSSDTFYAAYPMGQTDFDPSTVIDPDPPLPTENPCGENLTWTLGETGILTISGTGSMENYSAGTAPWAEDRQRIQSVVVGAGVTSIGSYAFYDCGNLTEVILSDSVAVLGEHAFEDCTALTGIDLPDGLKTIGEEVFLNCGLTEVTIPGSVMQIAYASFADCAGLRSVSFPEQLESIGAFSFSECASVESIEFPASLNTIGENAFYRCTGLKSICFNGDVPTIENNNCFAGVAAVAYYPPENTTWTQEALLDYGGTLNWGAQGTTVETTITQAEFEAALAAAKEAGEGYTLKKALILESRLSVWEAGCDITIAKGGSITVPDGVTFWFTGTIDGGSILVEDGGCLNLRKLDILSGSVEIAQGGEVYHCASISVYEGTLYAAPGATYVRDTGDILLYLEWGGTIEGLPAERIKLVTSVSSQAELEEMLAKAPDYGSIELRLEAGFVCGSSVVIPANAELYVSTAEGLTVGAGATLTNNGTIYVNLSSVLSVENGAALDNLGQIVVREGGSLTVSGTLTGNDPIYEGTTITQAEFEAQLAAAKEAGESYTLTKELTLTSDLTAGYGYSLILAEGGSITVPEGVTLRFRGTVNGGRILVENGGTLSGNELDLLSGSVTIEQGGVLYNESPIDVYGGTLSVASGGYSADQFAKLRLHLDGTGEIQGIEPARIKGVADISDTAELTEVLGKIVGYGTGELEFNTSFTLEQSVSIPENTEIMTQEDVVLTIPDGITLTLNHYSMLKNKILVQNGGTLSVQNGYPEIWGTTTVQSGGTLLIGESGTLTAFSGSLIVEEGGIVTTRPGGIRLYMNGKSSITGVEKSLISAKTELFVQDDTPLMDYFEAGSVYGSYELSLLDFFIQAEEVIEIPENSTLSLWGFTIPEGKTIINHGTIVVYGSELYINGTLDNQGQLLVYDENQLVVNGTVTGNAVTDATQTMDQAALQALLDEAAAEEDGLTYFDQMVVLTSDLEIPANVTVDMIWGGITVSNGTTLTVNGSVSAYNYPKILVKDGGCLRINGSISLGNSASITVETGGSVYVDGECKIRGSRIVDGKPYSLGGQLITQEGALVQINGTLSAAEGAVLAVQPGTVATALSNASQVTGMDSLLTVTSAPSTCEDLISVASAGAAYGRHEMAVDTDITLTENVSIPRNAVMTMTAKLTVPDGKSLTNAGAILLKTGSELLVQAGGTLTNRGTITENGGCLTKDGTLIDTVTEDLSNVASNAETMTADEIRSAVQDMDTQELAKAMENDEKDALANIAALEKAAGGQAEVNVEESLDISADQVSIVGANLNTAATDEAITLVIGTAEEKELPVEYDSETAVCFSMELTNVEELTVPVMITLPIPDEMDPQALVILHYHGDGEPEVLKPTISEAEGKFYASIVLTSFSDFVMALLRQPVRGDFDGDYALTVDDAAILLWDTIIEHSITAEEADFNGDKQVNSDDVVYLLWHILFPDLFSLS